MLYCSVDIAGFQKLICLPIKFSTTIKPAKLCKYNEVVQNKTLLSNFNFRCKIENGADSILFLLEITKYLIVFFFCCLVKPPLRELCM